MKLSNLTSNHRLPGNFIRELSNRRLPGNLLLLLSLLLIPFLASGQQSEATFAHSDSVAVGSTDTTDIFFSVLYQQASVWVQGGTGWLIFGAPDTTSWASRTEWVRAEENAVFTFGTLSKLRAIRAKMDSGTGVVYILGIKKVQQYSGLFDMDSEGWNNAFKLADIKWGDD